jgi:hypothetical protein
MIVLIGILVSILWPKTSSRPRVASNRTIVNDVLADSNEDKDNWEGFNYYKSVVVPAKGRYRIKYTDQRGMNTERDIDVKRAFDDQGKFAINAFCMMRQANRSFLDDRIQSAVNLDTGEIVGSVARDAIQQYVTSDEGVAYEQEKSVFAEIQKEWAGICILMFVAKADGRLVKKEREIVAEYLKAYCQDQSFSDDVLDKVIKQLNAPDQRQFESLVKQINKSGDVARLKLLFECAEKIIDTGKTVEPFEKYALEVLRRAVP